MRLSILCIFYAKPRKYPVAWRFHKQAQKPFLNEAFNRDWLSAPLTTGHLQEASAPVNAEEFGELCGGTGGVPYCVFASAPALITKIHIWHKQYVDGLLLETSQGPLPRIGGTGQHKDVHHTMLELGPQEVLVGVSLQCGNFIERITFHTSMRSLGPFGGGLGRGTIDLMAPEGRAIAGFQGRHWKFVDSLQLLLFPVPKLRPSKL